METERLEPPRGRKLHELDAESQELALVGLDGLVAQLRAKIATIRAGSQAYHELNRKIGTASTAAAILRRHLAETEA